MRAPVNVRRFFCLLSLGCLVSALAWKGLDSVRAGTNASSQAPTPALASYLPAESLVACVEFDGLAAHDAAWKQTAAAAILTQTTTGAMLQSLFQQFLDMAREGEAPLPLTGAEFSKVLEHLVQNGFALGVQVLEGELDKPVATLVFRGAGRAEFRPLVEKLIRASVPEGAPLQVITRQDGSKLSILQGEDAAPDVMFWFMGEELLVVVGGDDTRADQVASARDGKIASAAQSAVRAELMASSDGYEPALRAWFDASILPPTPPAAGLGALQRVDYTWGFSGPELKSVARILAPAPRTGVLSLFDQTPITSANFPPIPANVANYSVVSFDLARAYDVVTELAISLSPEAKEQIEALNTQFNQQTGRTSGTSLRDDLLAGLGPIMAGYAEVRTIENSINPLEVMAAWVFRMPPMVGLMQVRDPAKAAGAAEMLTRFANGLLAQTGSSGGPVRFEPLNAAEGQGYRLVVPPQVMPLPTSIDPGVVVGPQFAAITTSLAAGRRAVAPASGAAVERLRPDPSLLPPGLVFLEVHDPRGLLPDLLANLPFLVQLLGRMGPGTPFEPDNEANPFSRLNLDPKLTPSADAIRARLFPGSTTVTVDASGLTVVSRDSLPSFNSTGMLPVSVALFLPAVQSAREAAQRAQSINNLKQIALAMHNYASANDDRFPPAAICDPDGNLLLSWRVAILPFIDQQELYDEFHLDEPWDSEHNLELLAKIPPVYTAPGDRGGAEPGHTFYQVMVGDDALFSLDEPVGFGAITDGTSNTILAVEASAAVPWTKPEDIELDPEQDLPEFGGMGWAGGFNAAFADGSVRFLKHSIAMEVLKALITKAGGEVISADDL